jgi:hypothetical protein
MAAIKEEAKRMIDDLPEEASWDDIIYEFYVRKKIELGLKDIEDGNTVSLEEAEKTLLSDTE